MNKQEWLNKYKLPAGCALAVFGMWLYGTAAENEPLPPEPVSVVEEARLPEEKALPAADPASVPAEITVDVKGAVASPGIYVMQSGQRVHDAIQQAGGLTGKADAAAVNLAQKVQDEMVVYIPAQGEEPPVLPASPAPVPARGQAGEAAININTADESTLQELPGIGELKARAIIEYRETEGPFQTAEDLKNVSGIGDKTFEKLAPLIAVP